MLHQNAKLSAQRKALQFLIALMLLGSWSLALAAPPGNSSAAKHQSTPSRALVGHSAALNMALPVISAAKLLVRPVRLDEPRPTRGYFADPSPAQTKEPGGEKEAGMDIRWRESREIVSPDVVSMIRNYRRDGLPIVHLYQSDHNSLAIGLNPHGLPGIYFTRHIGG